MGVKFKTKKILQLGPFTSISQKLKFALGELYSVFIKNSRSTL